MSADEKKGTSTLPRVLILGRPNVGKSTLFNRVVRKRVAITDLVPHTTRDVLAAPAVHRRTWFELEDAAGFLDAPADKLSAAVQERLVNAVNAADLVLFMVDAAEGLTAVDAGIAEILRRTGKDHIICANKVHGPSEEVGAVEFYELGLGGEVLPISAKGGYNVKRLLDLVVERLGGEKAAEAPGPPVLKIAVAGRPNVGKSTLVNRILGAERVLVDEAAGTTRDAVDVTFDFGGERYMLVDTAGIRRMARKKDFLEGYSLNKALSAVKRADVAIIVLDAVEGATQQDARIAGYAHNRGTGTIIFINKTDLLKGTGVTAAARVEDVRRQMKYLAYAPAFVGSALADQDLTWLVTTASAVGENRRRRIPTAELNDFLARAFEGFRPTQKGRELRILYAVQTATEPPAFNLYINLRKEPHFSFKRFVENKLRDGYDFTGTPIVLRFKTKGESNRGGRR